MSHEPVSFMVNLYKSPQDDGYALTAEVITADGWATETEIIITRPFEIGDLSAALRLAADDLEGQIKGAATIISMDGYKEWLSQQAAELASTRE